MVSAVVEDELASESIKVVLEHSRRVLFSALDDLEGEKVIVWHRSLMHRVNLFAGASVLASHGVKHNVALDQLGVPSETPHVVFFLPPTLPALDEFCQFMDKLRPEAKTLYQVFFIPEAWYVVREKLKERDGGKYWERVEAVKELPLYWLPRDGAYLSLSESQLAARLLINGDWTLLHRCAVALNHLLQLVPDKVAIYSRGKWSQDMAQMLHGMRNNSDECANRGKTLKVNRVVLIDRWLDPLTPMLYQLTYAGLLDEIYGIGMVGSIKVSEDEFNESQGNDPFKMKDISLQDELFQKVRHSHIHGLGTEMAPVLTDIRKEEEYLKFDESKMTMAEYKLRLKSMPRTIKRKTLAGVHMRLGEMAKTTLYERYYDALMLQKGLLQSPDGDRVNSFIEELIIAAAPLNMVLRLLSVQSTTAGGLKPPVLVAYRRMIMQSYGIEALNRLLKIQKMGLIREKGGSGRLQCEYAPLMFPQMKKQYQLICEEVNEQDSSQPAYAYSGYVPLLARILEEGDQLKWAGWTKHGEHGGLDDDGTLVVIVGGATRSELSVLRGLHNVSLLVSTSILTGEKILNNLPII